MNDYKNLATLLFRVMGASYIVFAVLYWPYNLFICYVSNPSSAIIAPTLNALVYIAVGLFLYICGKRLAGFVVRGLDRD